jgi:hypothetical protein
MLLCWVEEERRSKYLQEDKLLEEGKKIEGMG